MSKLITLDSYSERAAMNVARLPVSREERARKRSAKEIARQGHDDVMLRMNSLKRRALKVSQHFEGYHVTKHVEKVTPAWVFLDDVGEPYVVEADSEWQARLLVERAYGVKSRDTVEPFNRRKHLGKGV